MARVARWRQMMERRDGAALKVIRGATITSSSLLINGDITSRLSAAYWRPIRMATWLRPIRRESRGIVSIYAGERHTPRHWMSYYPVILLRATVTARSRFVNYCCATTAAAITLSNNGIIEYTRHHGALFIIIRYVVVTTHCFTSLRRAPAEYILTYE